VKTESKNTRKRGRDLLTGTWFNADEYASEVEFTVTRDGDSYAVLARDTYDGEEADIFETAYTGDVLSFAAHWNSTGRFARYKLMLLSPNRLSVTYTYTDNEMYHRKRTKRKT
jgi:hypothetical protein